MLIPGGGNTTHPPAQPGATYHFGDLEVTSRAAEVERPGGAGNALLAGDLDGDETALIRDVMDLKSQRMSATLTRDSECHHGVSLAALLLTDAHDVPNLNGRGADHTERGQVLEGSTGRAAAGPILGTAPREVVTGGRAGGQGRAQKAEEDARDTHCVSS